MSVGAAMTLILRGLGASTEAVAVQIANWGGASGRTRASGSEAGWAADARHTRRVQTFLPYADFERSARALDRKRLGKQRVETIQVVRALTRPGYGWANGA